MKIYQHIYTKKLTLSQYEIRNSFEAVARLCMKITYGNFDGEVEGYNEETEVDTLEKYAANFGPGFPVKAYSKVT